MNKIVVGDIVTPKKSVVSTYTNMVISNGQPCEVISTPLYTDRSGTFLCCRTIYGGHLLHVDRKDMRKI